MKPHPFSSHKCVSGDAYELKTYTNPAIDSLKRLENVSVFDEKLGLLQPNRILEPIPSYLLKISNIFFSVFFSKRLFYSCPDFCFIFDPAYFRPFFLILILNNCERQPVGDRFSAAATHSHNMAGEKFSPLYCKTDLRYFMRSWTFQYIYFLNKNQN